MSYCRWAPGSDVYVFENFDGYIECCCCPLPGADSCFQAATAAEMDEHLQAHIAAGHDVPDGVIGNMTNPGEE